METQTIEIGADAPLAILPAAGAELAWRIAPDEDKRLAIWLDCQRRWLNALERRSGGRNTRRAYERDVAQFFLAYQLEDLHPWQVSRVHVSGWVEALVEAGLAEATINRKLAALSSLYEYASTEYTLLNVGEGEVALWQWANPFRGKSLRYKTQPYGKAVYPSTDEFRRLLGGIDLTTVTGLRNCCILAGMFATTRRVTEWLSLRWSDIHDGPDGEWFTYRYKGGDTRRQAIPADIWRLIELYLAQSGRDHMQPTDYLFIAHSAAAGRLPGIAEDYDPGEQHISASYVNQILKRYGAAADIAEERLHAHALRHAGARYRKEKGADVFELKDLLGHKSIATTQIYSDAVLESPTDARGDQIMADILPRQLKLLWK